MNMKLFSSADKEMGILGALIISVPIFFINMGGGMRAAGIAAVLQFGYSFLIISFNTRICRTYAKTNPLFAVLIPSTITTLLTYLLHWFAMSPEPFYTAAYACLTALGGFIPQTIRFRKSELSFFQLIKNWWTQKSW